MPRDLSLPIRIKNERYRDQLDKQRKREAVRKALEEQSALASDGMVKRYRLAEECGWRLPYEPDRGKIEVADLISGEVDIDHVIPRSHSYDNSWRNLVLCHRDTNRKKGNRTPWEFMQDDPVAWGRYETFIKNQKSMDRRKREWLLSKERPEEGFLNSQLVATGYIAKQAHALLGTLGVPVVVSRGIMTSDLRKIWGLDKLLPQWIEREERDTLEALGKDRDDYRHHAIDAIVVALTSRSVGLAITKAYKQRRPGDKIYLDKTCPITDLRQKLEAMVPQMPVTHAHHRDARGALNEATAKKPAQATASLPERATVSGGKLVRYDSRGLPAQEYQLGNNHHLAIYLSKEPNKKGQKDIAIQVVPLIEAARRKALDKPVFESDAPPSGYDLALVLCKGDWVEWCGDSPGLYRVAKFSTIGENGIDMQLQLPQLAKADNNLRNRTVNGVIPLVRITNKQKLTQIAARVVVNAFGEVVHSNPNLAHIP